VAGRVVTPGRPLLPCARPWMARFGRSLTRRRPDIPVAAATFR